MIIFYCFPFIYLQKILSIYWNYILKKIFILYCEVKKKCSFLLTCVRTNYPFPPLIHTQIFSLSGAILLLDAAFEHTKVFCNSRSILCRITYRIIFSRGMFLCFTQKYNTTTTTTTTLKEIVLLVVYVYLIERFSSLSIKIT